MLHPVDLLLSTDKNRIYFSRVVDLAVFQGLLTNDPNSEIGHFAFSQYYREGKDLDLTLRWDIERYESQKPLDAENRRRTLAITLDEVAEDFLALENEDKLKELILVGASYAVWPKGTSFVLTYPWDADGSRRPVRFRPDLSEFQKRRILEILKKTGLYRGINPFE